MKSLNNIISVIALLAGCMAYGAVHDLSDQGYTGRYCVGDTLDYDLDGEYVERVLISAQGIGRDGFIKVFADGELVHNIGVPGYDPDYTFRIRRPVERITLKFERTCSRILDMKIFTTAGSRPNDSFTRYVSGSENNWGVQLLEMINSISNRMLFSSTFQSDFWPNYLLPLKKIAMYHRASDSVRDPKSLKTAYYSLKMAKGISALLEYLEGREITGVLLDQFWFDLTLIKFDIFERYDIRECQLDREIAELQVIITG